MTRTKRKLALRSQTIAVLSRSDLQRVDGGRGGFRPPASQCSYEESGCINETKEP